MSVEESTAILFLAEGAAERAFYQKILEKHYSAEPAGLDNLPQPIRDLLAPLQARKPLTLRAGRADIVLIDCGGFDAIKLCLRRLMSRPELGEAVKAGLKAVIIAADLDKNPHESLKGLLASLASNVAEEDEALKLTVNNTTVKVHITAQGLKGRSDATMEIEDHLEELAEHHHPHLVKAVAALENTLSRRLNTKQKLTILWALLEEKPHPPPSMAAAIAEKASREELEKTVSHLLHIIDQYTRQQPTTKPEQH